MPADDARKPVRFRTTLTRSEWDDDVCAWRLELLRLPGSSVVKVFVDGDEQSGWTVEGEYLHWSGESRPREARVVVEVAYPSAAPADSDAITTLRAELEEAQTARKAAETQRTDFERQKVAAEETTKRWQIAAGVMTPLFGFLATVITLYVNADDEPKAIEAEPSPTATLEAPPLAPDVEPTPDSTDTTSPKLGGGPSPTGPDHKGVHDVEVGDVKLGKKAEGSIGNVHGQGDPNVGVGHVDVGEQGSISIGNQTSTGVSSPPGSGSGN